MERYGQPARDRDPPALSHVDRIFIADDKRGVDLRGEAGNDLVGSSSRTMRLTPRSARSERISGSPSTRKRLLPPLGARIIRSQGKEGDDRLPEHIAQRNRQVERSVVAAPLRPLHPIDDARRWGPVRPRGAHGPSGAASARSRRSARVETPNHVATRRSTRNGASYRARTRGQRQTPISTPYAYSPAIATRKRGVKEIHEKFMEKIYLHDYDRFRQ